MGELYDVCNSLYKYLEKNLFIICSSFLGSFVHALQYFHMLALTPDTLIY